MADRGSVLPAIAVIALGGVLMIGIGIDLARWGASWREAAYAADVGAEAGAAMIDEAAAHSGNVSIDEHLAAATAEDAALQARERPGRAATVTVSGDQVCVRVEQPFRATVARIASIENLSVAVEACARPAQG
jgi:hypothetical protein